MKEFRLILAAAATSFVVACAKKDAAPDTARQASSSAGPAPFALADAAGKWQMRSVPITGTDTTPTNYVMTATADTTGWDLTFAPSGLKVPLHITVSGDSILLKTDTYTSQRRKGVKVMTEGSAHLVGGKWVGSTTAHYQGVKDSVLKLRVEGTKIP